MNISQIRSNTVYRVLIRNRNEQESTKVLLGCAQYNTINSVLLLTSSHGNTYKVISLTH